MILITLLITLFLFDGMPVSAGNTRDVLKELDRTIETRDHYQKEKEVRISGIKTQLVNFTDKTEEFNMYSQLFDEYKYFQYDSAYVYARKLEKIAKKTLKKSDIAIAESALLFCFKSVGFFSEATAIIRDFKTEDVPDDLLVNYYILCAETYQNLSSYVSGAADLASGYDEKKLYYYNLALEHSSDHSFEHSWMTLEIKLIEDYSDKVAIEGRKSLIAQFNLSEHEKAVQYSILASAFNSLKKTDEAVYYRALSAICDIKSCTHETTSAKVLASEMYDRKDIKHAYLYIQQALFDAKFYNSRLRMVEINTILPIIQNSRYNWMNNQRVLSFLFGGFVMILLILTFILFLKLRKRNRQLFQVHKKLIANSGILRNTNISLSQVNGKLKETSEIKDQYIIQSLYGNTSFVNEIEKQSTFAIRKIIVRQYDDAIALLHNMGIREERARLYTSFDSAFLKLFPNFIEEFNTLFPKEAWIQLDERGALPMEVRIFALLRLGIDNTVQVANYLNLSVNTVYVYKTKLKSRAIVPKEKFESYIMAIPKP
ncbi:MAG: DUF6377 domain-containing protein [Bacteroidales bacterium]|jgi:hypothetical protein|nr:DUF6377 domain-containing protein [Bacteroidales bacterium]